MTAYDIVMAGADKVHEESQANKPTALEVIMAVRVILLENGHKANKMLNVLREYLNRTEKELMNEGEHASVDMVEGFNRAKKGSEIKQEEDENLDEENIMMGKFDRVTEQISNLYLGQPSETGRQMIMLSIENLINMSEKRITNHLNQSIDIG